MANGRIKRPAYQWYPADADGDEVFRLMSYEQQGVYRALLDHQWIQGDIPSDTANIAALLPKLTKERFDEIWPLISAKFRPHSNGRLINDRMDLQRRELDKYIRTQKKNARKRRPTKTSDASHGSAVAQPPQESSTSSSTSTSTTTAVQGGESAPAATPRTPAPIFARHEHRNHACCGKVCLPEALYRDFTKRVGHLSDPDTYVRDWFGIVNARYVSGDRQAEIIGDDAFDFWRKRWSDSHPSAISNRGKTAGNDAALATFVARHAEGKPS